MAPTKVEEEIALDKIQKWFTAAQVSKDCFNKWVVAARTPNQKETHSREPTVWMSLRWHPGFRLFDPTRLALKAAEDRAQAMEAAFGYRFKLKIAWKNAGWANAQGFNVQSGSQTYKDDDAEQS